MTTDDLIRTIGDVELPTPGWWPIAAHHPVHLTVGRFLRRPLNGSASGGLRIADHPNDSTLHLLVRPERGDTAHDLAIDARLTSAGADGTWRFKGSMQTTVTLPVTVDVTYHGVYRRGERATAWLTVHAGLPPAGGRPQSVLDAELNADFPVGPS